MSPAPGEAGASAPPHPAGRQGERAALHAPESNEKTGGTGQPAPVPRRGKLWPHALRAILSATLIWLVLRQVSMGDVLAALAGTLVHWPYLLAAAVIPGVNLCISALRWRVLISARGEERSLRTLCAALLVGVFYNQFLPSTIGGDVARSWWISKRTDPASLWRNLAVVAMDRTIALAGMCAVAVTAAAAAPAVARELPEFWIATCIVGGAIAVAALLALQPQAVAAARRLPVPSLLAGVRRKVGLVYETLVTYREKKRLLATAFALTIVFQLIMILHYVVLAGALGLHVDRLSLAVAVPIVTIVSLVPITVNGMGLREGTLALLGAPIGLAASDAVALAWLFVFMSLAYAVMGGIIQLAGGGFLFGAGKSYRGTPPARAVG